MSELIEHYASLMYESHFPGSDWHHASQEDVKEFRALATTKVGAELSDAAYQIRLGQLELMKANVLRESAELDLKNIKALLAEQNKALKAIRGVLNDSAQDSEAIDGILKGLGL